MSRERECRCLELEERVLKAEEKYIELESEMRKGKESDQESLIEQMMVNKALEFEKQVAENEAADWKRKFDKLVEAVQKLEEIGAFRDGEYELDESVKLGLELAKIKFPLGKKTESRQVSQEVLSREGLMCRQSSGSPNIVTPVKDCILERSRGNVSSRRPVKKMLSFEDDGSKQASIVDLCDSETKEMSERDTLDKGSEKESDAMDTLEEIYEDEDVEACEVNANASTTLPGRKRKLVIASESENDDDDEIPIAILKKLKPPSQEMSDLVDTSRTGQRRVSARLRKQRVVEESCNSSERNSKERLVGIPTTGKVEGDEIEEESEPESESESLDGFIVDDDSHETGSEKSDERGLEESDGEIGYADVISRLRRDKNPEKKREWEYEADMLADFGKDPELCMRAVCALYRFQTEGEKASRSSHVSNGRGFNKFDATRGSRIGEFLTDGDREGDLKKSVEELKDFDYEAVEICRELADRYSKQLFAIYENREDPFFVAPPSP